MENNIQPPSGAMQKEPDVWNRGALRQKLSSWGRGKEEEMLALTEIAQATVSESSAFEAIANAMRHVTEEDWQKIYAATRSRLLHSYHDGGDTRENRVFVHMDIFNALFDIRDAFDKQCATCKGTGVVKDYGDIVNTEWPCPTCKQKDQAQ